MDKVFACIKPNWNTVSKFCNRNDFLAFIYIYNQVSLSSLVLCLKNSFRYAMPCGQHLLVNSTSAGLKGL